MNNIVTGNIGTTTTAGTNIKTTDNTLKIRFGYFVLGETEIDVKFSTAYTDANRIFIVTNPTNSRGGGGAERVCRIVNVTASSFRADLQFTGAAGGNIGVFYIAMGF